MQKVNGLGSSVYDYLKEKILHLELLPGEKIPETKIARQFGISRTPIREAMRSLENEGLIRRYPNRFAEVATFPQSYVQQLGLVRLGLEKLSVQLAIFYGCNADFVKLKEKAQCCYDAAGRGDLQEQIRADTDFHRGIAALTRNPLIEKYLFELESQIQLLLAHKYIQASDSEESMRAHCDIMDAMIQRDEERAIALITEHLVSFYSLDSLYPFMHDSPQHTIV